MNFFSHRVWTNLSVGVGMVLAMAAGAVFILYRWAANTVPAPPPPAPRAEPQPLIVDAEPRGVVRYQLPGSVWVYVWMLNDGTRCVVADTAGSTLRPPSIACEWSAAKTPPPAMTKPKVGLL